MRDYLCIVLGMHIIMGLWAFKEGALGWLAWCLVCICTVLTLLSLKAEPHNKEDYHDDFYG